MPTQYLHRLLFVVPAASVTAFNTWIRNNLDASGGDWLVANLSASGSAPFSHGWCCFAATIPELKKVMQRLCTLASITPPADWDTKTKAQKKQWLVDQRQPIQTATGIRVHEMNNDGVWDNVQLALTAMGLQTPITP